MPRSYGQLARRILLVAVLCAGLAFAVVRPAGARESKIVSFRLPSKNIACAYISGFGKPFLRCDLLSGLAPEPRGACREGDWAAVYMTKTGRARPSCISDTVYDSRAPFLRYGHTWSHFGFTCRSRPTGLTCANSGRHGFFLSRQRWSVH